MSTVDRRHNTFISEMVDHGDQIKAYMVAYPQCKKEETARVNSYRLLQIATVASKIAEGQAEKARIIKEAKKKELEEAAKEKILSVTEVDAVLCEIILGKKLQERKVVVYNRQTGAYQTVTVQEPPDATQIVAAADKYYKRHGHYAANKIEDVTDYSDVLVPGE